MPLVSDIILIVLRVGLELLAYYNAKVMYRTGEFQSRISPLFITYLTHSIVSFLILQDIIKSKFRYLKKVEQETNLTPKRFLFFTFLLSFIFNLSHIPKYFSLNKFSDLFIVSVSCLSVLSTHWLCIFTGRKRITFTCVLFTFLSTCGLIILVMDECKIARKFILAILLFAGSIVGGFYTVFMKIFMDHRSRGYSRAQRQLPVVEPANSSQKSELQNSQSISNTQNTTVEPFYDDISSDKFVNHQKINTINFNDQIDVDTLTQSMDTEDTLKGMVPFESHDSLERQSSDENTLMKSQNESFDDLQTKNDQKVDQNDVKNLNSEENRNKTVHLNVSEQITENVVETLNNPGSSENEMSMDKFTWYLISLINRDKIKNNKIRDLLFMKHYLGTTGILTLFLYWPMIIFPMHKQSLSINGIRLLFHVFMCNLLSVSQNVLYFVLVTVKSPHFIQLSGMILQPTIICLEMIMNMTCFTLRLVGFGLIFISLFFIG